MYKIPNPVRLCHKFDDKGERDVLWYFESEEELLGIPNFFDEKQLTTHFKMVVVLLDHDSYYLGHAEVSQILPDGTNNIKEIMQLALLANASKIVIGANKVQGFGEKVIATPKECQFAKEIYQACKIMNIGFKGYRIFEQSSFRYLIFTPVSPKLISRGSKIVLLE